MAQVDNLSTCFFVQPKGVIFSKSCKISNYCSAFCMTLLQVIKMCSRPRVLRHAKMAELQGGLPQTHGFQNVITLRIITINKSKTAPINSCFKLMLRCPAPFGVGQSGRWPSQGSQLPWANPSSNHFLLSCPLNECEKQHSILKSVAFLFSVFSFF